MRLGWGKGHLQVCIQHPQRCGGRGRPGRQPPKGESLLEHVVAPTSSILSPLDHLLDNISIILKISLLPSGLPELIGEQRRPHSAPLSVRKGIPTLCVNPRPVIQVATSLTSGRMKISLNQEVYLPLAAPFPLGP